MVHCPVDPGNSIQWAKAPAYTTQLVHQLSLLPTHDATHHLVFSQATRRSLQWKQRRQQALLTVTRALFSSGGDPFRERKQSESVLRRITTCVSLPLLALLLPCPCPLYLRVVRSRVSTPSIEPVRKLDPRLLARSALAAASSKLTSRIELPTLTPCAPTASAKSTRTTSSRSRQTLTPSRPRSVRRPDEPPSLVAPPLTCGSRYATHSLDPPALLLL